MNANQKQFKTVKLGDVCDQLRGVSYNKSDATAVPVSGSVPVLRANNIDDGLINLDDLVYVPRRLILSRQFIKKGDVVIAASSGSLSVVGKAAQARKDIDAGFGAFCKLLRPGEKVNSGFFGYYFQNRKYRHTISSLAAGANINNLKNEHINDLDFPDLPLPEQKRIAEILDLADEARRNRRENLKLYDDLIRSLFLQTFGDPVSNPMGWAEGTIRDLVTEAKYGTSEKSHLTTGKYPVLRMGNITYEGNWDFSDLKYMDLDDNELDKYLVHKGDLLFNRTNSRELVGKTAVYREDKPMAYAGYLIRVRPNEHANIEYIAAYLNSAWAKHYLRDKCKSIVGMANINAQELQNIPIPKPPVKIQHQFAVKVTEINAQKAREQALYKQHDDLFNSLLQRAFKGDL